MTYWTLTYNGTEKSFGDWGLGKAKRNRRNAALTEMTFVADGQPIDTADLFAFESVVVVMRDRVLSGASYSGGSQFFQGYVTDAHRMGNGSSESVAYTVSNVWWLLQSIFYKQNWPSVGFTDHVILNRVPAYALQWLGVRSQIQAILDYALTKMPGAFTYDVSALPNIFPPCDEKRSLTCDEAIKNQMQWLQDGIAKVDETQSPPKIYFYTRFGDTVFTSTPVNQLPSVTLAIGTGTAGERVLVSSESIKPLKKLVVPQVQINYEQNNKVGAQESLVLVSDIYPATPDGGNQLNIICQTVNLLGVQGTDQNAYMDSRDLSQYAAADWQAWFVQSHPFLDKVTNLALVDGHVFFTDDANNALDAFTVFSATPFEMLNHGTFHSWMKVGNVANGAPGVKTRVKVTAYFSYTDEFGNVVDTVNGRELTVAVDLVNLAPGTYNKVDLTQLPDLVPGLVSAGPGGVNLVWNYTLGTADTYGLSLAFWLYSTLRVLQWEGEVEIDDNRGDGEVSRTDFMGVLLNLSNGLPSWMTMDALVQSVSEDLDSGKTVVSFGQNKYLGAGKLLDLARQNRTRAYTSFQQTMAQGGLLNGTVNSPDGVARKDSTRGNAKLNKDLVQFVDPTGTTTQLIRDAVNQALTLQSTDPSQGACSLSLADLVAATKP